VTSLTGNSLKYTEAGFVKIDLALRETVSSHRNSEERTAPRFIATLTVTDTGKGISQEYLQIKFYPPFSQRIKVGYRIWSAFEYGE
jgi:signal transduction histidine kinase